MKIDRKKFNRDFIGPKKRALKKLIENAQSGCRLALGVEDAKRLSVWADHWKCAESYLRIVNAVMVFAGTCDRLEAIITEFKARAQRGSDDYKAANLFAVNMLKEYQVEQEKLQESVAAV